MKKKTILLLLAITFTFALSACGQTIDTTTNEVHTVETTSKFNSETEPDEPDEPTPTTNKEPENNPIEIASTTDEVVAKNTTENSLNSKEAPKSETKPKTQKTKTNKTKKNKTKKKYTVKSISEKTMYATSDCNIRKGPSTNYDRVGSLSRAQKVTVNGKVTYQDKTWFRLKTTDGSEQFVASSLLSDTKPTTTQKSNTQKSNTNSSNTQKNTNNNSTKPSNNTNKDTQKPSNNNSNSSSSNDLIPKRKDLIRYDDVPVEPGSHKGDFSNDFGWNAE